MSGMFDAARNARHTVATTCGPKRAGARPFCRAGLGMFVMCIAVCILSFGCRSTMPQCEPQTAPSALVADVTDGDDGCTLLAVDASGVRFPTSLALAELATGARPNSAEWEPASETRPDVSVRAAERAEFADEAARTPGEAAALRRVPPCNWRAYRQRTRAAGSRLFADCTPCAICGFSRQ